MQSPAEETPDAVNAFTSLSERLQRARSTLRGVLLGQDAVAELGLVTVVAGGSALMVGPAAATSRLTQALSRVVGVEPARLSGRVDFTPAEVRAAPDVRGRTPREPTRLRPVTHISGFDRMAPVVRARLIEASRTGAYVAEGQTARTPWPLHLLAEAGPETLDAAEREAFLVTLSLTYPDREVERQWLLGTEAVPVPAAVLEPGDLEAARRLVSQVPVGASVIDALLDLVRRLRPDGSEASAEVKAWMARGPGPEAGQAILKLIRARALVHGRAAPSIEDIRAVAPAALSPRVTLAPEAPDDALSRLCQRLLSDA